MAHYDQSTNDWCRDYNGELDQSFGDFYIKCKNHIEIKHCTGNALSCYIPSLSRGYNILRKIYTDKISSNEEELPSVEIIAKKLVEAQILIDIDILSIEMYFTFKSKDIDYIAKLVGASTTGSNIGALSNKNLPKNKYQIPEIDLQLYEELKNKLPEVKRVLHGKEIQMVNGLIVKSLISNFDAVIKKLKGKGFDMDADRKKKCIKGIDYIHEIGLWKEFIQYMGIEVEKLSKCK